MKSLREWLNFQLSASQKIMRLFETIQARENKLATLNELNQIKNFQSMVKITVKKITSDGAEVKTQLVKYSHELC